MGYYGSFYQAIPENTGLFRLLRDDRKAETVLAFMFPRWDRPLDIRFDLRINQVELMEDLFRSMAFDESTRRDREENRSALENNDLFRKIKEDPNAGVFTAHLLGDDGPLFEMLRNMVYTPGDLLDQLLAKSNLFDTRPDVERSWKSLSDEIDRACAAHPGLMDRSARVESPMELIEARLVQRDHREIQARIIGQDGWFFDADTSFSEREPDQGSNRFGVVIPSTVKLVSDNLENMEMVPHPYEYGDCVFNDYQVLKHLYQEAAGLGEAIIIFKDDYDVEEV